MRVPFANAQLVANCRPIQDRKESARISRTSAQAGKKFIRAPSREAKVGNVKAMLHDPHPDLVVGQSIYDLDLRLCSRSRVSVFSQFCVNAGDTLVLLD